MTITDEMVEKARLAARVYLEEDGEDSNYCSRPMMRIALEAVAPMLIAAELRIWGDDIFEHVRTKDLRDRAQELDPR